jgi:hypothetical protein
MSPRIATVALAATVTWGSPARAQLVCPEGRINLTEALERVPALAEAQATQRVAENRLQVEKERPNPRAAKQIQAPSHASSSASPVDAPSLPELLGLAVDSKLLNVGDQQAFSASLNPFAFVSLARSAMSEQEYQSYSWLRRLDGQVSLGGQGDSFDRDGDGKADEALQAKELSDSVSWEVRLRVFGSRDRRETSFVRQFERAVLQPLEEEIGAAKEVARVLAGAADTNGCLTEADVTRVLSVSDHRAKLQRLATTSRTTRETIDRTIKDIDRRLVVTVFASGTRRETELGPDKMGFGLRAGWGRGLLDHTFNVDWNQLENLAGAPDARTFKVGYEASGELSGAGFEGSKVSLFAAFEHYSNVPNAKHPTIAKAGGKLDVRLADGLRLPLSVTWANHQDLLTGADTIVGNVAVTLDLSDLRKKKPTP